MIQKALFVGFAVLAASFVMPAYAYMYAAQDATTSNILPQTQYISIDGIIGLEKTTLSFHSPTSNDLPWGFVEGNITNHVSGHPVIIQFFRDGQAVHFAQVDVSDTGAYEYKFRILDYIDGQTINVFEGDYTVIIFKTVYLPGANPI